MNKHFKDLNLDSIIKLANKHLKTDIAIKKMEEPIFYHDYNKFMFEHKCLDEGIQTIYKYGLFPVDKSYDLTKDIDYAEKGGAFELDEFIRIYTDIITSINVAFYFKTNLKLAETLSKKLGDLVDLSVLKNAYNRIFDESFNVKDSASGLLNDIRRRIRKNEKSIKSLIVDELRRYKDLLNDTTYYVKAGVYVLPVKTSFKNRVDGLIYDVSDSGETTFIQPTKCLSLSNEIYKDTNLEKEEIKKIFRSLTNETMIYKNELLRNNVIFSELDILNSKFKFLKEIDGNVIETKNDSHFNIHNGRHPLIEKEKVVANDIEIKDTTNQLIISGPNAGGKSVFLKLIGVMVCLNQMIYPLPCSENSSIGFFKKVYTDIGDLQSIEHNLSTFSAHICNISEFLKKVQKDDLVLIDELGTGTDPNDGESLAIAICNYLNSTGCKSIVTSHFDGMKQYSFTNDKIMCGSMIFDEKNMMPHYKLQIGIPGKSYGILIAKKYGINEDIINEATEYLGNLKKIDNDEYVIRLNKEISDVQKLKDDYSSKIKELEDKLATANKNNEVLQGKLKNFEKDTNELRNEILEETRQKIDEIKRQMLKNPNLKLHDLINFGTELEEVEINTEEEEEVVETFNPGDYVLDDFSGVEGKIVAVKKEKLELITDGGKRYTLTIRPSIRKIVHSNKKAKVKPSGDAFINVKPLNFELNLIGMHVDEALIELEYYIDKAAMQHKEKIRVIHGFGTGALRNAVHSYLKKCKYVKSFKLGGEFDGGLGSTIVYLK